MISMNYNYIYVYWFKRYNDYIMNGKEIIRKYWCKIKSLIIENLNLIIII